MKTLCYLLLFFYFASIDMNAYGLPGSSGYSRGSSRVAPRMLNTRRIKNIYGVNVGSELSSNPKIFGDYDGLSNNYFGSLNANSRNSRSASDYGTSDFATNCKVTTDPHEMRYGGGMGYENGFSACEAAEYKEYLKRN